MRWITGLSSLTLFLTLAACSSGGGSAPPPPPPTVTTNLQGQLIIASVGSASMDQLAFDGDAYNARSAGRVERGSPLSISGEVGPIDVDRQDVLRIHVPAGPVAFRVDAAASLSAVLHILEPDTGRQVLRADAGQVAVVDVQSATTLDVIVEVLRGQGTYLFDAQAFPALTTADASVPLTGSAAAVRTEAQARYLGAQHEMIPGEVIVVLDAPPLDNPAFDASAAGVVPVRPATGDRNLGLYRVALTTATSHRAGTPLEQSIEIETCLAAKRVAALPGVLAASPNYVRRALQQTPDDPYYALQWHYQMLRMGLAWDITRGSTDVVVGVADTGIVSQHPDFDGRLVSGYDFISDPLNARDGDGRDPNPEDEGDLSNPPDSSWHGTHVAGTIGARTDNGLGVAGMDWSCKILPLRVLGVQGGSSLDILEAVKFAAGLPNASGTTPQVPAGRVDVLNMSLGGPGGSSVEEAIYAQVRQAGVLVVAAAGNEPDTVPGYPGSYPSTISVGSVRLDKTRAFYSNRATTVDLMAPGGDMTIDQNGDGYPDGVLSCFKQPASSPPYVYSFEMGTSMAAPQVAGLASLALAARPGATPDILEQLIFDNTEDLGSPGRDPVYQRGLIDPLATLRAAANSIPTDPVLSSTPNAVSVGNVQTTGDVTLSNVGAQTVRLMVTGATIDYAAAGSGWLTATLIDAPGDPTISHDNLDLVVDRTGLADGTYSATVEFQTTNAPPASIIVTMEVGIVSSSDVFYLLLVEITTEGFETRAQSDTSALEAFQWRLVGTDVVPIPDGSYLLAAGTDRDGDNLIGDEGELFGVWPIDSAPELIGLTADTETRFRTGMNFPVTANSQISSVRRTGLRLLR